MLGKTTLLRHLMTNAGGRRIALVINEFGDVGMDRESLSACGNQGCGDDDIVVLANGCLCCTVADEFLPTMEALIHRAEPPDPIVIETSGLAEALAPVVQAGRVLRIKGTLDVPGRPMRMLVQGVGPRLQAHYDRPRRPDETRAGTLVVIGIKGLDTEALRTGLAAVVAGGKDVLTSAAE